MQQEPELVTIPKGVNVVCHADNKLQNGMAYVMLSRSECMDNVFLTEDFDLSMIRCVKEALIENKKLEKRCIVSKEKAKKFNIFYANAQNLNHHLPLNSPISLPPFSSGA